MFVLVLPVLAVDVVDAIGVSDGAHLDIRLRVEVMEVVPVSQEFLSNLNFARNSFVCNTP